MNIKSEYKYYSMNSGSLMEDETGHLPGIEWKDESGHSWRGVITGIDFSEFVSKKIVFTYTKFIKPFGIDEWISHSFKNVSIDNGKNIDLNTGEPTEGEGMPQFDYFIYLIGKNTPSVPVGMFYLFTQEIDRLEK